MAYKFKTSKGIEYIEHNDTKIFLVLLDASKPGEDKNKIMRLQQTIILAETEEAAQTAAFFKGFKVITIKPFYKMMDQLKKALKV